jgi:hypothetical protein
MGTVYTRNVTSDPDTGIGRWSAADLGRALRDGRAPNGRALSPLDMPWTVSRGPDGPRRRGAARVPDDDAAGEESGSAAGGRVARRRRRAEARSARHRRAALGGVRTRQRGPCAGRRGKPRRRRRTRAPELWLLAALVALAVVAPRRVRWITVALGVGIVALYVWPGLRWDAAVARQGDGRRSKLSGAHSPCRPSVVPPPASRGTATTRPSSRARVATSRRSARARSVTPPARASRDSGPPSPSWAAACASVGRCSAPSGRGT